MQPSEVIPRLSSDIDHDLDKALDFFVNMLRIRAVNPRMGGPGEAERAEFIRSFLRTEGFDVTRADVPDQAARGGVRPNLCARLEGRDGGKTLWFFVHMDTVPEGSASLWRSDPFEPKVEGGKVYARGAEDNGQSLVSCLFALRELKRLGEETPVGVGVWFVSDEESGSNYGVKHVLAHQPVGPADLVVVPDTGTADGSEVQLAEKSLLWLKVVTKGKQVHASRPGKGRNAHREGMKLALAVDEGLHRRFDGRDELFDEPRSTFEPTKVDPGVANVNTIPGVDTTYFDCRVLPQYTLDSVLSEAGSLIRGFASRNGAEASLEIVQRDDAGAPTPRSSEVAELTAKAVATVTGRKPRFVGTGLRTVGNIFREKGIPTAVWSTIDNVPHEPNEYARVASLISDAKVFAAMPFLCSPMR
jgi:succinyl-diaminopimelate desuccinylase